MIKQVIIIRKDLNMRKGKMCTQAAHASTKVLLDKMLIDSVYYKNQNYKYERRLEIIKDSSLDKWLSGKFTKIVVSCDSEEELIEVYNKARAKNLLCSIITDAGLTEFKEECSRCTGMGWSVCDKKSIEGYPPCYECNGTGKINKPTLTAVAIGPAEDKDVDEITGHLKLL